MSLVCGRGAWRDSLALKASNSSSSDWNMYIYVVIFRGCLTLFAVFFIYFFFSIFIRDTGGPQLVRFQLVRSPV
jgi:ABC-type arginine transport system permease subunit